MDKNNLMKHCYLYKGEDENPYSSSEYPLFIFWASEFYFVHVHHKRMNIIKPFFENCGLFVPEGADSELVYSLWATYNHYLKQDPEDLAKTFPELLNQYLQYQKE